MRMARGSRWSSTRPTTRPRRTGSIRRAKATKPRHSYTAKTLKACVWELIYAGTYLPDGTHNGAGGEFFIDDEGNVDPEADAALCEALQP